MAKFIKLLLLLIILPLQVFALDNQIETIDDNFYLLEPPPPPAEFARPSKIEKQVPAATQILGNEYLSVDVLVVIYTNCVMDTITQTDIDKLYLEVDEGEEFFWRNSRCRFDLNITYEIIDRNLELDEFWLLYPPGGYWLSFWRQNGVNSIEDDLYALGYTDNQFASVFVYYAWANDDTAYAAIGGGAYGPDVGFMGQTAYASVPLCWDPNTNDWLFIHEFHHCLDGMFHASGLPEYPHADIPSDYTGDFDDGYSFNGWMLREWEWDKWGQMGSTWGSVFAFEDLDNDSVPDIGNFLISEQTFGSSSSLIDSDNDGLNDLHELSAGYFTSSSPLDIDTDNDGLQDGEDAYPLDKVYTKLLYIGNDFIIDGSITSNEGFYLLDFIDEIPTNLNAVFNGGYTDSGLYFNAIVYDDTIDTPWDDPWWNDGINLKLDATNDGYWVHGSDNYRINISPRGNQLDPLRRLYIIHDDGTQDESFIPATDLTAAYTKYSDRYEIEFFLKMNSLTGFIISDTTVLPMQLEIFDYDTYPGWDRHGLFSKFIEFELEPNWICGDINNDGSMPIISDLTFLVDYLFNNGNAPEFIDAGDINNDGVIGISDLTYFVDYLFNNGRAPDCN